MQKGKSQFFDNGVRAPERTTGSDVSPHTPIETDGIRVTPPARVAAGLKSVLKAAEFTLREPGLVRGLAALSNLNQFEGTDCPGCAWPDPDHDRALNEYCENGVKGDHRGSDCQTLYA